MSITVEIPDGKLIPRGIAYGEVTYGVRMVKGAPHLLEFWNGPHGMDILQLNPQRPWVTGLARTLRKDQDESEQFKI